MTQYEINVTGKVQGVGYRFFAHQKANEIGIKGWVKNGRTGEVLIVAQGTKTDLLTFLDYLKIGPTRARVINISKYEMQALNVFSGFEIQS